MSDQGIAGFALGQERCTAARNTLVVYGSGLNQAFHGLTACRWSDLCPREPLGELLLTQITPREGTGSLRHRLVLNELMAYSPRAATVELYADVQARSQHYLGRQRSPVLPLQLNFDAPARSPEKGANPWRRPLR